MKFFSVFRMQQLLTCYDNNDLLALGERYGYNVHNTRGYNYITGGGGMVFSRRMLDVLAAPGGCDCPSNNTPDDMFLGICIARAGVAVTHSPLFHQVNEAEVVQFKGGHCVVCSRHGPSIMHLAIWRWRTLSRSINIG